MMSSHARCGRSSPAAALTTSAPLIVESLHKSCSAGLVVLQPLYEDSVAVGVSLATFGVTSPPKRRTNWQGKALAKFMTGTRCLCETMGRTDIDLSVVDVGTGVQRRVLGFAGEHFCRAMCVGEWVLDFDGWRLWRVTEDRSDWYHRDGGGPMVVSRPRSVRPFAGMVGQSSFSFRHMAGDVGDRFFDMRCYGDGLCVFHLFDMEKMFESGVMEPIDTVKVPIPRALISPTAHCFWASKRVMVQSEGVYYEVLKGGELKLLCRNPDQTFTMHNFWIVLRKESPNQCESWDFSVSPKAEQPTVISLPESDDPIRLMSGAKLLIVEGGSRVHAVDPASGAIIFTLMAPLLHRIHKQTLCEHERLSLKFGELIQIISKRKKKEEDVVWAHSSMSFLETVPQRQPTIVVHLNAHDQFIALATSSNPRCGAHSPAHSITEQPALRMQLWEMCFHNTHSATTSTTWLGISVTRRPQFTTGSCAFTTLVSFKLSRALSGVIPASVGVSPTWRNDGMSSHSATCVPAPQVNWNNMGFNVLEKVGWLTEVSNDHYFYEYRIILTDVTATTGKTSSKRGDNQSGLRRVKGWYDAYSSGISVANRKWFVHESKYSLGISEVLGSGHLNNRIVVTAALQTSFCMLFLNKADPDEAVVVIDNQHGSGLFSRIDVPQTHQGGKLATKSETPWLNPAATQITIGLVFTRLEGFHCFVLMTAPSGSDLNDGSDEDSDAVWHLEETTGISKKLCDKHAHGLSQLDDTTFCVSLDSEYQLWSSW
ncbi:hypothetical protein Pelo_17793 [Pelomyxa schiedti]|nr:hypothetical protein Pelo_17793 [Pelomyxa schiedti]